MPNCCHRYTIAIATQITKNGDVGYLDNGSEYPYNVWGFNTDVGTFDSDAYGFQNAADNIIGTKSFYTDPGTWTSIPWAVNHYSSAVQNYTRAFLLSYAAVANDGWVGDGDSGGNDQFNNIEYEAYAWGSPWLYFYPLLNHFLYSSQDSYSPSALSALENYINTAPFDGCMYNPISSIPVGSNPQNVPCWTGTTNFIIPNSTSPGDFNGLDFMLLYNLYWLDHNYNGTDSNFFTNGMNYSYGNILDTNNPIKTNGHVFRDAPVFLADSIGGTGINITDTIESTFSVGLYPGFNVQSGSTVSIEIANNQNSIVPVSEICNGFNVSLAAGANAYNIMALVYNCVAFYVEVSMRL